MQAAGSSCAVLRVKKAEYASDVLKFETLISDVTQHLQAVQQKVQERQAEASEKQQQESGLREEQRLIQHTLAAQEFTPLQIQSMSSTHHTHSMQRAGPLRPHPCCLLSPVRPSPLLRQCTSSK